LGKLRDGAERIDDAKELTWRGGPRAKSHFYFGARVSEAGMLRDLSLAFRKSDRAWNAPTRF